MDQATQTPNEPDAYYGDADANTDEIDLSFLDEDEDDHAGVNPSESE